MALTEDGKPKKGDAAPLEGLVPSEIMRVLNLGFLSISATMARDLAMRVGPALDTPLTNNHLPLSKTSPFLNMPSFTAPTPPKS